VEDQFWDLENNIQWTNFFRNHRNMELAAYEGNGSPPPNKNTATCKIWWGSPGRTLVDVLNNIAASNNLWLT
jgi:hypothetical protein